jgi:hypothetical protein
MYKYFGKVGKEDFAFRNGKHRIRKNCGLPISWNGSVKRSNAEPA